MQPDNRIRIEDLGVLTIRNNGDSKRFVTHDRVGCPRNAVIEQFNGYSRCWACRTPLTDGANAYVIENARTQGPKDGDAFVWNADFYHRRPNGRR